MVDAEYFLCVAYFVLFITWAWVMVRVSRVQFADMSPTSLRPPEYRLVRQPGGEAGVACATSG